jgi:hypothetical protein
VNVRARNYGFELRFEGDFVVDNSITLRQFYKSLKSMQSAIDRSYMDIADTQLRKHAHLHHSKHHLADIYFDQTEVGSFKIKFLKPEEIMKQILDRLSNVVIAPYERSLGANQDLMRTLEDDYEARLAQVNNRLIQIQTYSTEVEDDLVTRNFSERSIVKEVDQLISPLRSGSDQNHIDLQIIGTNTNLFEFNANNANRFHKIVSKRELGTPCLYNVNIRVINANTKKAHVNNIATGNQCTLHFRNTEVFNDFADRYNVNQNIMIIASPVLEYSTYDANAGDIYFINHG